jgi:hypothetical protein
MALRTRNANTKSHLKDASLMKSCVASPLNTVAGIAK